MLSYEEALKLVKSHVKNDKLVKHMIAVGEIMHDLATRLGEDPKLWRLVGLLHDIDYEETKNNPRMHGLRSAEILEGMLPEEALKAIKAHNDLTGFKYESKLTYALKAADQVSGLIVATALVMPHKKLCEVKVESLIKKFKKKDFARRVDRSKILLCEKLGLSLREFLEISLKALQRIHEKLGL